MQDSQPTVEAALTIKDYVLFFGPLAGVVIGGVVTSVGKWIELKHQWKIEKRRLTLDKLEAAQSSLYELTLHVQGSYLAYVKACYKIQDRDERIDKFPVISADGDSYMAKVEAAIILHAPELGTEVDSLSLLYSNYNGAALDALSDGSEENILKMDQAYKAYADEMNKFGRKLVNKIVAVRDARNVISDS